VILFVKRYLRKCDRSEVEILQVATAWWKVDAILDLDQDSDAWFLNLNLIWIATKLLSFQSPAAAEAVLRTSVMKEPCLLV